VEAAAVGFAFVVSVRVMVERGIRLGRVSGREERGGFVVCGRMMIACHDEMRNSNGWSRVANAIRLFWRLDPMSVFDSGCDVEGRSGLA